MNNFCCLVKIMIKTTTSVNCSCCWDSDVQLYSCTEGHYSCKECLQKGIEILVNENRNISCISDCCVGYYPEKLLKSVIEDTSLIEKYNMNNFVNILSKITLDNLYKCPFCPNRVVIDEIAEMSTFFCIDGCKSYSCVKCKKTAHEGNCNLDHHSEDERKTQEFLITCCGVSFFRGDACNKVSCPRCKQYYCWICKEKIYNYNHFKIGNCKLYGERLEKNVEPNGVVPNYQRPERFVRPEVGTRPVIVEREITVPGTIGTRPAGLIPNGMVPHYQRPQNFYRQEVVARPIIVPATIGTRPAGLIPNGVSIAEMFPMQNRRRSVRCLGITSKRRQCARFTLSPLRLCQNHR
jgi:hypothetical protein